MSRRLDALAVRFFGTALVGAILLPLGALAQQPAKPPAAKPTAPAAPQTPAANTQAQVSPSHLALAREVMFNSGIARSFDSIIPALAEQIKKNTVTRPELGKDLDEVIKSLQPEMDLQKQRMIDVAGRIYAGRLNEAELKEIVAFFRSPAGKRYVETQPQVLDELVGAMQDWTQEVSEYMMIRVRAEMGKRGHQLQ
ncbi:DUF2059 domain-containing protein [Methylobacterium haplocladii]|uniref:DUF2059 domain-containing protein n=1 Tax=Methylobacterium haplocladii TaxID=1176176 RepID=A0A512IT87_9HYPH|nr:DUF2059 domain-containing protein [Methylobacterium haplocladii]GEP00913.1 hypothetical protein MHA02_33000 [Methylobacterium haplocladii]GJD82239.1 hypothetical protein HPGCJGGD_0091 [Methylobacterium haplocladii]GLS58855.1 hypothetical protein GCM10007887_15210 [Methylobacterium haplocladii]